MASNSFAKRSSTELSVHTNLKLKLELAAQRAAD
jgi:hypothetical protein